MYKPLNDIGQAMQEGMSFLNESDSCIVINQPTPNAAAKSNSLYEAFSFAALQTPHQPKDCGKINNPEEFSQPVLEDGSPFTVDLVIKAPGTPFFVPDRLSQFAPAIHQAIEDHYSKGTPASDDYCTIYISQGTVAPNTYLRNKTKHIDAYTAEVLQGKQLNTDVYLATDYLSPNFFIQPYDIDTAGCIDEKGNIAADVHAKISAQIDKQTKEEGAISFPALHMVNHDSTMVHQARAPMETHDRTFIQVAFSKDNHEAEQGISNNRWLQDYIERQNQPAPSSRATNSYSPMALR